MMRPTLTTDFLISGKENKSSASTSQRHTLQTDMAVLDIILIAMAHNSCLTQIGTKLEHVSVDSPASTMVLI